MPFSIPYYGFQIILNIKKTVIFTDSLNSLFLIRGSLKNTYFSLVSQIQKLLFKIVTSSQQVVIQWIPSHNIPQNDLVDKIAKEACFYSFITPLNLEFEEYICLLKSKLYSYKNQLWTEHKASLAISSVIENIWEWKWISSGSKHCDTLLARFRNGHVGLRKYLYKVKVVDSPFCLFCPGNIEENIFHFLFDCPKYINSRNNLKASLNKLNVLTNPISLSVLLDGAGFSPQKRLKIMWIFYNFLKSTDKFQIL